MSAPEKRLVLELERVSKSYGGVHAVQHVDLEVWSSEIHAIVGDNGAGKSTLMKIVAGAHAPDDGIIRRDGMPVEIRSPQHAARLGIATVYQDLALVDTRTVAQNLFMGHEPTRGLVVDRRRMDAEAGSALGELRIHVPSVTTRVGRLSGGQRQGVAIARAVRQGDAILLLDEPTAALGVQESHKVLELVTRLRDAGRALLLVSHNLRDVFEIADRITVLRRGRIVGTRMTAATTPEQIVGMITGGAEIV